MRLFTLSIVLYFSLLASATNAQPLEPIPRGTIANADRTRLNRFLDRLRSHGDYHATGRARLHIHGDGIPCPETTAPAEMLYVTSNRKYIIKSNRVYRIWGDISVFNRDTRVLNTTGCGNPFEQSGNAATERESLARFAATPLLHVVEMLRRPQYVEGMLDHVERISFRENPDSDTKRYQLTFRYRDRGGVEQLYFDQGAKFLTAARFTFDPSLRPPGVDEMFATWKLDPGIVNPHRGHRASHVQEVASAVQAALSRVTSESASVCRSEFDGPQVRGGSVGPSGMGLIIQWLCKQAGFESCAGSE